VDTPHSPLPPPPPRTCDATVGNSNILPNQILAHCANNVILPPEIVVNTEVKQEQTSRIKPVPRTQIQRLLKIQNCRTTLNVLKRNNRQILIKFVSLYKQYILLDFASQDRPENFGKLHGKFDYSPSAKNTLVAYQKDEHSLKKIRTLFLNIYGLYFKEVSDSTQIFTATV
jgi:hypothetical protein